MWRLLGPSIKKVYKMITEACGIFYKEYWATSKSNGPSFERKEVQQPEGTLNIRMTIFFILLLNDAMIM